MEVVAVILALGVGYAIGFNESRIYKLLKELERKPALDVGATPGAYSKVNDFNFNQPGETGLVLPKTPEMLAWEDEERQREAQHKVVVKPRE